LLAVALVQRFRADGQEAGGDLQLGLVLVILGFGSKQVAGELFANELIVGLVGIERGDDPVAVAPGVRIGEVGSPAARLGIAGHVEPVPAPALAELRRAEQPVHRRFQGDLRLGGIRLHELLDVFRRRRQTGQVERKAAQQRPRIGVSDRLQVPGLQAGQNEAVDVALWPGRVLDRRQTDLLQRLERPEGAALVDVDLVLRDLGGGIARVGSAHGDPLLEIGDDLAAQLLLGRHLEIFLGVVLEPLDKQALRRLARNDGRSGVASLEQAAAAIERQSPLDLLGRRRVAGIALLDQHRPDLLLKESDLVCREGLVDGRLRLLGTLSPCGRPYRPSGHENTDDREVRQRLHEITSLQVDRRNYRKK